MIARRIKSGTLLDNKRQEKKFTLKFWICSRYWKNSSIIKCSNLRKKLFNNLMNLPFYRFLNHLWEEDLCCKFLNLLNFSKDNLVSLRHWQKKKLWFRSWWAFQNAMSQSSINRYSSCLKFLKAHQKFSWHAWQVQWAKNCHNRWRRVSLKLMSR